MTQEKTQPEATPDAGAASTTIAAIGELIDDADAWAVVMGTIAHLAPGAPFIKQIIYNQSRSPLRQALATLPNADEVHTAIESGLAALGR